MNKIQDNLFENINLVIKDKGYSIDSLSYFKAGSKNNKSKLLIVISKIDNTPVTVKDCSIVSKLVAVLIDVKNLITEAYILEVTSKGCDDTLFFLNDFIKSIGKLVKVKLKNNNNDSCFYGTIFKVKDSKIFLKKYCNKTGNYNEKNCITLSINDIDNAMLIKDAIEGEINESTTRIR